MSIEGQTFYPADKATPGELFLLATEYQRAAELLLRSGRKRAPLSYSPYRFIAIHAIELYLNAFLREKGHAVEAMRRMQHNLASRADLAVAGGLDLRLSTNDHLVMLTKAKEYWAARYWPKPFEEASELNRIDATLKEIAKKVGAAVSCDKK